MATAALAQEGWSTEPASIDMPAAQADAGSRNANKAGWRGLLRAGALGQAGGSRLGGEACGGVSASDRPLSGVLGVRAAWRIPASQCDLASRLCLMGQRQGRGRGSLDQRFSELVPGPAA